MFKKTDIIKNLFENVLHNKIILYNTESQEGVDKKIIRNIKIISEVDSNIVLTEPIHNNNPNIKKIRIIKDKLIDELKKSHYKNIRHKLFIIKYFISLNIIDENLTEIDILKQNISYKDNNIIDTFSENKNKYTNDINQIIDNNNNYSYDAQISNKDINSKYCIHLKNNNKFDCRICQPGKKIVMRNLKKCPVNLPYNLDTNIYSHININSNLNYKGDTYRIFAYLSQPGKQLIYRRKKILYGIPNNTDIFTWVVNKEYKDYILLSKTNTDNPDDTISIKANNPDIINSNLETDTLDRINENNNDFHLNNFYIQNIVPASNESNVNYKFPNSHQLYIKPENDYYYIYFIENNIKYYMYLNVEENKSIYQIVFREDTYSENEPFIKNNTKWRFVKTSDYIENIFEATRKLYNIRSKVFIDESNKDDIKSLVANNNTCYDYNNLLNNYFITDYDLINNTKFKFTGYNNNYKITSFIENSECIFNNKDILQFDSHNKKQRKNNNEEENNIKDKSKYNKLLDELKEKKITYYLIKNPVDETYLYLDDITNADTPIIDFRSYESLGNIDENKIQLSNNDFVPDNFLWVVEDSILNDTIMKSKINKINNRYNKILTESISNVEYNIQTKNNKKQSLILQKQIQDANVIAQNASSSPEEVSAALATIRNNTNALANTGAVANTCSSKYWCSSKYSYK